MLKTRLFVFDLEVKRVQMRPQRVASARCLRGTWCGFGGFCCRWRRGCARHGATRWPHAARCQDLRWEGGFGLREDRGLEPRPLDQEDAEERVALLHESVRQPPLAGPRPCHVSTAGRTASKSFSGSTYPRRFSEHADLLRDPCSVPLAHHRSQRARPHPVSFL
eukprot:2391698-Rhodomonas_salina.3